jgi:hypothetical protein
VRTSLLNLISTPIPILNSLGLEVAVGLSSEDPIGGRRAAETFTALASIYDADGGLLERRVLGEIPPRRRRMFDLTALTRPLVKDDHLAVAHRIPSRLLAGGNDLDAVVELDAGDADFAMYRSLVQYAYPGGSNGSVIYETPPSFNVARPGRAPASTLTFTSKVTVSEEVETALALIHYSTDPAYARTARYWYALFAPDGERVGDGAVTVAPFTVGVVRVRTALMPGTVARYTSADDGLAWLGYVGYSTDAALIPLILTLSPGRGSVSVEHTHPAQAYTLPAKPEDKHKVKGRAVALWAARLSGARGPGAAS